MPGAVASRSGRGVRYPVAVRERVIDYARARRVEGASWAHVASELGLRFETVRRWCHAGGGVERPRAIRPVEIVVGDQRMALSIVTPSGIRVEGATLEDTIALLRALG
jgi:hypothetical protein